MVSDERAFEAACSQARRCWVAMPCCMYLSKKLLLQLPHVLVKAELQALSALLQQPLLLTPDPLQLSEHRLKVSLSLVDACSSLQQLPESDLELSLASRCLQTVSHLSASWHAEPLHAAAVLAADGQH